MSVSTGIGGVSASLRNLLVGEMSLSPAVDVTILAPDEGGGDRRVNLFLYRVEENAFLRNGDWQLKPTDPTTLVPPPLSLNLFYLMTPYARNDAQTGNTTAHEILGEAMRVFYESPIVSAQYLDNSLSGAREQLRITPNMLEPEELGRLWTTFSQPFRLSVLYQVSTVQLDQAASKQRPFPKRVRQIGVPGMEAPYIPPTVTSMSPSSAAAGSVLTFTGQNLAGWKADVSVANQNVLQGQTLTSDTFNAVAPASLQPGFYDLRVDVSHLFRRTFLFEVTP